VARSLPVDRIPRLLACATQVFIANGYTQTRMDDVAELLGVAKGTLYLYVESKDALFDLVIRAADRGDVAPELPVKTPRAGATLAYIGKRLAEDDELRGLTSALARNAELAVVAGKLFDLLVQNRTVIKLLDRTARDIPQLGRSWSGGARRELVVAIARYLQRGMRDGTVRRMPDAGIAARFVVETCAFWAVHRFWDGSPIEVAEDQVRPTVLELVCAALASPGKERT
jgi:AcrR family transcriptional regulator